MIKSANKYQISDIFNPDAKVKYVIPKFQREYVWGKEHWENLFNDLIENDKGHFLGSIICIDKGSDALEIAPLEVVDGQQRLTTISLLYLSIYSRLIEEDLIDEDFIASRINLKNKIIQKSHKNQLKIELSYQNNNYSDYCYILKELNLITDFTRHFNVGNRRIYKAYRYFKGKIQDITSLETIMNFLDRINSAWLVKIEVDSHADAFILFESLNNRGEPLSAIDLIKNKMLSELEKNQVMSIDNSFEEWVKIINYIPDYKTQERFLRQFYNAFRYKDSIKIKNYSIATRSNLITIYEGLIEKEVKLIFDELITKASSYNRLIAPSPDIPIYKGLTDLINLGAAPAFTLLLYLISEYGKNNNLLKQSTDFLIKYTVRRNLTDFPNTRDLDRIFIGLIDECEKNKDNLNFRVIEEYLTQPARFSDNESFEKRLKGDIYEENAPVARFLLCKIEESHQTRENRKDLWEKNNKGSFIWTVEHIFPEGENIPQSWVDMIAVGDIQKAKDLQNKYVHRLGNLTLTAYNSNLSNFSFDKKQNLTDKCGNSIGYKNGLYLNRELSIKDGWEISDIEDRTEKLVQEVLSIF